jgi:hypothetical protein
MALAIAVADMSSARVADRYVKETPFSFLFAVADPSSSRAGSFDLFGATVERV